MYDHETALYNFSQNSLTNAQRYERFNTKVDIGTAIGIIRQHKVLLEYVAAELGVTKFDDLSEKIQKDVCAQAEEQYLAYVFLCQSGKQHNKLRMDLQNEFTTGKRQVSKAPAIHPPSRRQVHQVYNSDPNNL